MLEEYEELNYQLEKRVGELLDENERLRDLCEKYEEEHRTTFEEWKKAINIINELEKWLRSEIKRLEDIQNPKKGIKPYGEEYNHYTLLIGAYDNALDKLQELKGVDK